MRYHHFFMFVTFLNSCSSSPKSTFYQLNTLNINEGQVYDSKTSVNLNKIEIPDNINHSRIVVKKDHHILDISEFHRWGSNLEQEIQNTIAENLSIELKSNQIFVENNMNLKDIDYTLNIDFRELNGTLGDKIYLNANWILFHNKTKKTITRKTALHRKLDDSSYVNYVKNMELLIIEFSKVISREIKELQ